MTVTHRTYRCTFQPLDRDGYPVPCETGVMPYLVLMARDAEAAQRLAFDRCKAPIVGVERIDPSASAGTAVQALHAKDLDQSRADAVGPAEEDDERTVVYSREDFQRLLARGAFSHDLHDVDDPASGRLAVLGLVVRRRDVEHALPYLRDMRAAIGRLRDARHEALAVGESVEDQDVLAARLAGDGADDAHGDSSSVILTDCRRPITGAACETGCFELDDAANIDWPAWQGRSVILTVSAGVPA